jgi:P pilus assembly chaperone PapD
MNLIENSIHGFVGRRRGYTLIGLSFLSVLFFLTLAPTTAETSVTVDSESLYTAYKTETADVIKARSGRYHIVTDRTVIIETASGVAAIKNGEAKFTVTPHSLKIEALDNTTLIQTESGTTIVAEGQTLQLTSTPPPQDPVLTSLGMCE